MSWTSDQLAQLESQRELMIRYLDIRRTREDWHGVMDACADIREIDAQMKILRDGLAVVIKS